RVLFRCHRPGSSLLGSRTLDFGSDGSAPSVMRSDAMPRSPKGTRWLWHLFCFGVGDMDGLGGDGRFISTRRESWLTAVGLLRIDWLEDNLHRCSFFTRHH